MVIPVSERSDTIGPMARTVKDAAYILQAIVGRDPHDNYTSAMPSKIPNYISACSASSLNNSRIGVPHNVLSLLATNTSAPILSAFSTALALLRAHGAKVIPTTFPLAEPYLASPIPSSLTFADYTANLASYFAQLSSNPHHLRSLADLRAFTQRHPQEAYPDRDTGLWDAALQQGWNNTDPRFWPAYLQNLAYGTEGGVLGALQRDDLDAVVLPSEFAPHWAAGVGSPVVALPLGAYPVGTPVVRSERGLVVVGPGVP
ncbi:hypothetical protein J1614_000786 [Plenodomus biglobosus]|nr:hypothetical protein J1614_000786 [Plenodomus biglobosus]